MPKRQTQSRGATQVFVWDLDNTLAERDVALLENEFFRIKPFPNHADIAFPGRIA